MTRLLLPRPLRVVTVAAFLLFGLVTPGTAAGASVTFGTPTAKSTFGQSIVFTQPYSGGGVQSAQIAITTPGDPGPTILPIDNPGTTSLRYSLDTSTGNVSPFEPLQAQFRVVLAGGDVQSGPTVSVVYADDRFSWQAVSGNTVTIHWFQGTAAFARQLLAYGEQGIAKSAAFLGASATKQIDFYVYPNQQAFAAGLSVPETIGGQAQAAYRTCYALVAPNDLAYGSTVVPHELTHIVFADLTDNPYHSPPRWLNEGLAVYLSEGYGSDNRSLVSQAASKGTLVPLAALAGYFALDQARIYQSYAEAVSAVDLMVRRFGQPAIQKMIATYGQGASDDEAFKAAFGMGMAAFDAAWQADNKVSAAPTYGPQPAPTGPLPAAWSGSSATNPPVAPTEVPTSASSTAPAEPTPAGSSSDTAVLLLAAVIGGGGILILVLAALMHLGSGSTR